MANKKAAKFPFAFDQFLFKDIFKTGIFKDSLKQKQKVFLTAFVKLSFRHFQNPFYGFFNPASKM